MHYRLPLHWQSGCSGDAEPSEGADIAATPG